MLAWQALQPQQPFICSRRCDKHWPSCCVATNSNYFQRTGIDSKSASGSAAGQHSSDPTLHTADTVALDRVLHSLQTQADLESLTMLLKLLAKGYLELDEDAVDENKVQYHQP